MILELEMLQAKLAGIPAFPQELKTLLEHMIISHHGHYEFGSPKLPMFPEALMLHYLDDLDSKMESMRAQFERDADSSEPWSGYNSSLARPLLNSRKVLEKLRNPARQEAPTEQEAGGQGEQAAAAAAASEPSPSQGPSQGSAEGEPAAVSQQSLLQLERRFVRPGAGGSKSAK
jgi:3'-5' exoribonuclease